MQAVRAGPTLTGAAQLTIAPDAAHTEVRPKRLRADSWGRHLKETDRRNLWYESFWALLPDFFPG